VKTFNHENLTKSTEKTSDESMDFDATLSEKAAAADSSSEKSQFYYDADTYSNRHSESSDVVYFYDDKVENWIQRDDDISDDMKLKMSLNEEPLDLSVRHNSR